MSLAWPTPTELVEQVGSLISRALEGLTRLLDGLRREWHILALMLAGAGTPEVSRHTWHTMADHNSALISRAANVALAYMVVWAFGILGGCLFWSLVGLWAVSGGKAGIRIRGYWRAIEAVAKGRLIIAVNHPSLLEPILIPLMFFPWYCFWPRFFVWSVPDRRLLPRRLRWLFPLGRCITVDRSESRRQNQTAFRDIPMVLHRRDVIVIHPDTGPNRYRIQPTGH